MSPDKIHPAITIERVADAAERDMSSLDNPGFCNACGEDAEGVEPDAWGYECEVCGEGQVYGYMEYLFAMG